MSKSSSGSNSEDERKFRRVYLKHIKITPDDLKRELKRPREQRKTIRQLTEELRDNLWTATEEIHENAPAPQPGHRILYRVHGDVDEEPDLKSAAEKSGQRVLSVEEKESLVALHAEKNKKSEDGLNSPFVSTTSDIRTFVSCTFQEGPAGDPNLRNEVFESAPFVSTFSVPSDNCIEVMHGPGKGEKEVLYDTSDNPLLPHRNAISSNPFQGRVKVALDRLSGSRGQSISEAKDLDKMYNTISKDEPITEHIVNQYSEWYKGQTRLYNHLVKMPKQQITAAPKGPARSTPVNGRVPAATDTVNQLRESGFGEAPSRSSVSATPARAALTNAQGKKSCCVIM